LFRHYHRHHPHLAGKIHPLYSTAALSILPLAPPSSRELFVPPSTDATARDHRGAVVFNLGSPSSGVCSATVVSSVQSELTFLISHFCILFTCACSCACRLI
jgi:hypothetical protein